MPIGPTLDLVNFLLADVRGGLGPYVQVYLVTRAGWDQGTLGNVLTFSGLLGVALHPLVGAFIDATRAKRALLAAGVLLLAGAALAIVAAPILPVVVAADVVMAVLGAVFAPGIAALTMGLYAGPMLAARFGRNAAFDKAGNLFIAGFSAVVGTWFGQAAVFLASPLFGLASVAALMTIPAGAIDHRRARGSAPAADASAAQAAPETVLPVGALLRRPQVILLTLLAATFHFANAPLLNMLSQKLALAHPGHESAYTSAAIMIGQAATIPVALLLRRVAIIGQRPFLALALLALPLRAGLFALTDDPVLLLAGQILDGLGGGLFDALLPLLVADAVWGSGRYTFARGLIGTVQGVFGSISNGVGGTLIVRYGYDTAFAGFAAAGLVAVLAGLLWAVRALPERAPGKPA